MSLLQLPADVRLAIYAYAGVPGLGTPHICDVEPEEDDFSIFWGFRCPADGKLLSKIGNIDLNNRPAACDASSHRGSATLSLLLLCSAMYTELARHIYSHNQIVIRAKDDASLGALSGLRVISIHALRRLTIELNATSCGLGWACDDEADPCDSWRDERDPRDLETARDQEAARLLREWTRENQSLMTGEQNDGHHSPLSIYDYSQSRPLTITNELHKVSEDGSNTQRCERSTLPPFYTLGREIEHSLVVFGRVRSSITSLRPEMSSVLS
jgi:hypothetical protein